VLGLTMGDPAGVGPELCLQALRQAAALGCVPVLFGDAGVLGRLCPRWLQETKCQVLSLADWENGARVEGPLVVDCRAIDARALKPGRVSAAAGRAAYTYICHAIRAALDGRIEGVEETRP
jgi:4-phospho-D-threonate 3-dehydrogenase / 4-phospho-D-erythronate 3-dehydrogenase